MSWFKRHLNWTFTLGLIVGLIPLILIGFIHNSAVGYIIWIVTLLLISSWTLWQKGRSYLYLILVLWVAVIAIPVILCLKNKKKELERTTQPPSTQT